MKSGRYLTGSQKETEDLGRRLGQNLKIPSIILLEGALGAGKTTLTRGIVEGFGCTNPDAVHSPTFSLVNEYDCERGLIYHIDLYRLETLRDLYSIGIDELIASDAIIIIEWAEKLLFSVDFTWKVTIEMEPDETREITFEEN